MLHIRPRYAILLATLALSVPASAGYQAITIHGEDDPTAVGTFVTKFEGELHTLDITVEDASVELDVITEEPTNGLWDIESTRPNGATFRLADASAHQDHSSRFSFRQKSNGGGSGGGGGGNKLYDAIAQQIQIFASYPGEPAEEVPRPTRQGEDYYGVVLNENATKPVHIRLVYNRERQDEFYPSTISLRIASGLKIINRPPGQDTAESIAESLLPGTEVSFDVIHDKDRVPVLEEAQGITLVLTDQYGSIHEDEVSLGPVDLDFIKPGTEEDETPEEIAEDKEDTEGEVVNVNWDDDDNSEGNGGHAKLAFKNDFENPEKTKGENDLIQLKLHASGVPGFKARMKYDPTYVKIWQKADRSDEVKSEETLLDLTEEKILYLEGLKITDAEIATMIEKQYKLPAQDGFKLGDTVSAHVATPIITFYGKHLWTSGYGSQNLCDQLHNRNFLGKKRRDDRNNTVILRGKDQQNKVLWYSVDMFDIETSAKGDLLDDRPLVQVRAPELDKEMKMAMSLPGAHLYYNGHSNFGLGPNFTRRGTTTVDDYMNLSGRGITAIVLKSEDTSISMLSLDHGGPNFALRPADVVNEVTNSPLVPVSGLAKFTPPLAFGQTLAKQTHADGTPYHYDRDSRDGHEWLTVVNSTGDKPVLRYASCFMASCDTGRHFPETLDHGVLLFTMGESAGILGGEDGQLDNDLYTVSAAGSDAYSWITSHYVRMLTEGKSWEQIVKFLNQNQFTMPDMEVNQSLYKYKPFE
jgi:hypothetical protein